MTKQINTEDFKSEVLQSKGLVLVDFFATWCGPCKMLAPTLAEIGQENEDIKVVSVDVDQNQQLAMQYGIMSVPTMIIFKDGNKMGQFVGLLPKATILERLQEYR